MTPIDSSATTGQRASEVRLMHVVHGLPRGGLERGVVNLANGLPYPRFCQSVVCLDERGAMADLVVPRVKVFTLNRGRNDPKTPFRLARLVAHWRPHILHCRNWNAWPDTVAARLIVRVLGLRPALVWSFHGFADGDGMPLRRRHACRLLAAATDRLAAVCRDSASRFAEIAGLASTKFTVLYNGVDCSGFAPPSAERRLVLRAELGLPADKLIVLTVASLKPVKNHVQLVNSIAELDAGRRDRLMVVLVGEGALRAELQALIDGRHLNAVVGFAGASDRVPALLQAADMMVLPSRLEGMSNAILEAMATGLPVIANRAGGNPELVIGGVTGHLCEVGDSQAMCRAIMALMDNPAHRAAFGNAARHRVSESFSLEAMMGRYAAFYDSLAPPESSAPRDGHADGPGTSAQGIL